jgi:hypothetical protein
MLFGGPQVVQHAPLHSQQKGAWNASNQGNDAENEEGRVIINAITLEQEIETQPSQRT